VRPLATTVQSTSASPNSSTFTVAPARVLPRRGRQDVGRTGSGSLGRLHRGGRAPVPRLPGVSGDGKRHCEDDHPKRPGHVSSLQPSQAIGPSRTHPANGTHRSVLVAWVTQRGTHLATYCRTPPPAERPVRSLLGGTSASGAQSRSSAGRSHCAPRPSNTPATSRRWRSRVGRHATLRPPATLR
jgi:hypothetical protein